MVIIPEQSLCEVTHINAMLHILCKHLSSLLRSHCFLKKKSLDDTATGIL